MYQKNSLVPPILALALAFFPWIISSITSQVGKLKSNDLKDPIITVAVNGDNTMLIGLWYLVMLLVCYFSRMYCWDHGIRTGERIVDGFNSLLFIMPLLNLVVFLKVYYFQFNKKLQQWN